MAAVAACGCRGLIPSGCLRVKSISLLLIVVLTFTACARPERLTRQDAEDLVRATFRDGDPVYADVPLRVSWSESSPRDEFDVRSAETLDRLERLGLVTIARQIDGGTGVIEATLTPAGQRVLGSVHSVRGPAARGRIAERRVDGVGRIDLHPGDPTKGRVEVLWHYDSPTSLYEAFLTRQDKPLNEPFASVISMAWSQGAWRAEIVVRKTRPSSRDD